MAVTQRVADAIQRRARVCRCPAAHGLASRSPRARHGRKLTAALRPLQLRVVNESHLHAGHAGNPSGAPGAETHFRVEIVSDAFSGLSPVARHRLVYDALRTELAEGLHALALRTKTAAEEAGKRS